MTHLNFLKYNIIGALDTEQHKLLTSTHTTVPFSSAWTEYIHSYSIKISIL